MARPPGNADKLMIAAGKEIARRDGCSALRIREVADRAGVNLGMFHYHFKNRKRFTRILLGEVYGEFFSRLTGIVESRADALTQLRGSLVLFGQFVRDNRRILTALFKDILNDEPEVIRFARRNTPPHVAVIQGLIKKCQKAGLLPRLPLSQLLPLLIGALTPPVLMAEVFEKTGKRLDWFDLDVVMSDRAMGERIDIVLRGLEKYKP